MLELLAAPTARKSLLVGMNGHVFTDVLFTGKSLATYITRVWTFTYGSEASLNHVELYLQHRKIATFHALYGNQKFKYLKPY